MGVDHKKIILTGRRLANAKYPYDEKCFRYGYCMKKTLDFYLLSSHLHRHPSLPDLKTSRSAQRWTLQILEGHCHFGHLIFCRARCIIGREQGKPIFEVLIKMELHFSSQWIPDKKIMSWETSKLPIHCLDPRNDFGLSWISTRVFWISLMLGTHLESQEFL